MLFKYRSGVYFTYNVLQNYKSIARNEAKISKKQTNKQRQKQKQNQSEKGKNLRLLKMIKSF